MFTLIIAALIYPTNLTYLKKFWQNIEFNQPINYVAEGDSLIIVTADEKLKQDIEKYWC
jgi:hypothetical protein